MAKGLFVFLIALATSQLAFSEESAAIDGAKKPRCQFNHECGYWWGFVTKEKEVDGDEEEQEFVMTPPAKPESKEEACSKKSTWSADCGFIDPKEDYEFMVVQREALSKGMLMQSTDQKSVHEFQKFVKWAVDSSTEAAHTWQYTMMQDQDVNPFVTHPVSRFGLKSVIGLASAKKESVFKEIADQGGILVFWTRSDCSWCHSMAESVIRVSKETGIPSVNIPLDGMCLEGFIGDACIETTELTMEAARSLQVKYVPDLFLLLGGAKATPENWVRISSGIESRETIKNRISTFFGGVRAAAIAGLDNSKNIFSGSNRPATTFDVNSFNPNLNSSSSVKWGPQGNGKNNE